MSLPKPQANTFVVVTGASSGIGTEIARGLARRGHNLILVARRADRLEELANEVGSKYNVTATVQPADLGNPGHRQKLIETLVGQPIVGLVNSAGFGTKGVFHELPLSREREEVEVNVVALMELTHALVPGMVARGAGAVLNIASIAGAQPVPSMAVYGASKAFVDSFSQAINAELHGTGVSVTSLCPGPVPTEWAEIAEAQAFVFRPAQVSPKQVAEEAIVGMLKGKSSVVPGLVVKAATIAGRMTPRSISMPVIRTLGGRK
ncbi:SDR family NAD(P)-dependent oxidoreductase [Smaragdicoccus niigatensis]|uniref:SDR family NAD(P)-dependent oxidoreductase n=1 Tax=Smaragdicoccus niigatensis TaxID=359359 RepID=UPI0003787A35|nr:SDR family oxidoreductase [Smaragdicoccus niigatensis]